MINDFAWPYAFALLPLPLLVRHWLGEWHNQQAALKLPFYEQLPLLAGQRSRSRLLPLILHSLAWICLLTALARPQETGEIIELPASGRSLMMAVDLSGSMETADMILGGRQATRLEAVKIVASEFIERREGDRLGLILFGRQAYLQTPLTFDRKTNIRLLNEAMINMAGKETAIGDAIGLAVKRLRNLEDEQRVLILLTDGANTAGEITPLKAADLAAAENIRIHTIGIGADRMNVSSLFGSRQINPSADLDEETLSNIAGKTGGRYFRARNPEELEEIYKLLDELEPVEVEQQVFRPIEEKFYWPLSFYLLFTCMIFVLRPGGGEGG